MTEAQFTTRFGTWFWINKDKFAPNIAFEFKVTKGGTFNLKQWRKRQGHQIRALYAVKSNVGYYHKWSDQSQDIKGYDASYQSKAEAWLVIYFDKYKEFFIFREIPAVDSIKYKDLSNPFILLPAKKKMKVIHI